VSSVAKAARPTHHRPPTIHRLAYSKQEAATCLGVSVDFLEEHVLPDLRITRLGRRVLIPVTELERFLRETAMRTL
jgi:excisionase family DNA binding protein